MSQLPGPIGRRTMLAGLGASGWTAAAAALGPSHAAGLDASGLPALLARLAEDPWVVQIGSRYLERAPREASSTVLAQAVARALDGSGSARSVRTLCAALDRQCRADFSKGRTVALDGWVLGVTEARLFALASLQPSVPAPNG